MTNIYFSKKQIVKAISQVKLADKQIKTLTLSVGENEIRITQQFEPLRKLGFDLMLTNTNSEEKFSVSYDLKTFNKVLKAAKTNDRIEVASNGDLIIGETTYSIAEAVYEGIAKQSYSHEDETEVLTLSGSEAVKLKTAIAGVLSSASKDKLKSVYTCVNIKVEPNYIATVATNGHTLSAYGIDTLRSASGKDFNLEGNVAKLLVSVLERIDENHIHGCEFVFSNDGVLKEIRIGSPTELEYIYLDSEHARFKFPSYQALIPKKYDSESIITLKELKHEIQNAEIKDSFRLQLDGCIWFKVAYCKQLMDLLVGFGKLTDNDEFTLLHSGLPPAMVRINQNLTFLLMPSEAISRKLAQTESLS